MELPKYRCHKVVQAAKIVAMDYNALTNGRFLALENGTAPRHIVAVDRDWIERHEPTEGGYYVLYEDGYASYSPAKAFEEGYTLVEVEQAPTPRRT